MIAPSITVESLRKSYGGTPVVSDVSFTCTPGRITGFLGPNGAGKSTTLRMITGLTRPDSGTSTVGGRPYTQLPNPPRVVGALLDPTAMHSGRSGRATLGIAAEMAGMPQQRIDEVLHMVGLNGAAAAKRVGNYSLGMRQRLGLAQALLAEPQMLILDEPVNGLDPEGIAWMRQMLRDFTDRGGTVLLSSHLLHEVQATVDDMVVISGGTVVAAGPMEELLATSAVVVRSPDTDALAGLLTETGASFSPTADGAFTVDSSVAGLDQDRIAQLALDRHLLVTELRQADSTRLEDLFFTLTHSPVAHAPGQQEVPA